MKNLKNRIKKSFIGEMAVAKLHEIEGLVLPALISDETAVKRFYKRTTGRELNLKNPVTLSEKMNWYKLNKRQFLMQQCADKVAVRDYVCSLGYECLLNDVYGVYEKVSDIDISMLPDRFVLKAAHGSHMNYIVKNKSTINWKHAKLMMRSWLHQNIYWGGREWVYRDIPKRIIAEKYLEDSSGELKDYKFFCFHGEPQYLQYDGNRFNGKHYRNYYDMDKQLLDMDDDVGHNPNIDFPLSDADLERMKEIARDLSKPFPFVRTDFYLVNGKIFFGELTFFHNGGITWFKPEEYDTIMGNLWDISI